MYLKPLLTPHFFRHNYVTLLYEAGVDPLIAMKIVGHTDYQTTANIYTHVRDLSEDSRPLFEPHDVDDIRAYLGCSEKGDIELVCEKDGKVLKSVPSRLKKDEYILGLIENKKALSEQQRRTKRFLEQAMEDGMALSAEEILICLSEQPCISFMSSTDCSSISSVAWR